MEVQQSYPALDPAANSMNTTGDDQNPTYDETTPLYWGHYYASNPYGLDNTNTHCVNFLTNPSPDYASYDTTTSPTMDLANNWNTSSLYATQPSFYSDSPTTDTSNSPAPVMSRRKSIVTHFEDHSSKRAAEPKEKSTCKQPRRTSTRKKSMDDEPESKTKPKTKVKPRPKARSKPDQTTQEIEMEEPKASSRKSSVATPKEKEDEMTKKIQERNRVASNKFRVKKREDAK